MRGQPRVRGSFSHPVLFTQGSKWRFHTRRSLSDTWHFFQPGDVIECVTPINNVLKILACSGDINQYMRESDERKYKHNDRVTGTVGLDKIYRYVDQIEAGTPVVYYLCKTFVNEGRTGFGYYFSGKDKNYPNVNDFSDAAYWENRLLALKALFRENGFGARRPYEHYKLMAYDARTDEHTEISVEHVAASAKWLHDQVAERNNKLAVMRALSDAVLKNFDAFSGLVAVRMPRFGMEEENTVKRFCNRMNLRKPIVFVDRLAFFGSLDDAMLVKMGLQGYEVVTCQ